MDKRDDWGINRLKESSQQQRQIIDLFSFFVEIEESVEVLNLYDILICSHSLPNVLLSS